MMLIQILVPQMPYFILQVEEYAKTHNLSGPDQPIIFYKTKLH